MWLVSCTSVPNLFSVFKDRLDKNVEGWQQDIPGVTERERADFFDLTSFYITTDTHSILSILVAH